MADARDSDETRAKDPAEPGNELRDLLQDCLSPQTVAWVAKRLANQLWMGFPRDKKVAEEVAWLVQRLEEVVGGHEAVERLCQKIDH